MEKRRLKTRNCSSRTHFLRYASNEKELKTTPEQIWENSPDLAMSLFWKMLEDALKLRRFNQKPNQNVYQGHFVSLHHEQ